MSAVNERNAHFHSMHMVHENDFLSKMQTTLQMGKLRPILVCDKVAIDWGKGGRVLCAIMIRAHGIAALSLLVKISVSLDFELQGQFVF